MWQGRISFLEKAGFEMILSNGNSIVKTFEHYAI